MAVGQDSPNEAAAEPEPVAMTEVTLEQVTSQLEEAENSKDLDDAEKAQVKELYSQAQQELETAAAQQDSADKFKAWSAKAQQDLESAKRQKDTPEKVFDLQAAENRNLAQLTNDLSSLEQQHTDAKQQLLEAQPEPQRRVNRRAEIPKELSAAQTELASLEGLLQSFQDDGASPLVSKARKTVLQARLQAQQGVISALESERNAYDAQGELPSLQIDVLTAKVSLLEEALRGLVKIVTTLRQQDASAQQEDAQLQWESTAEALRPLAQENIDYAKRRFDLAGLIGESATTKEQIAKQLARWQKDFSRTENRAEAGISDTLGMMLIEKRSQLPSVSLLQQKAQDKEKAIGQLQREIFDLEDRRTELSNLSGAIETTQLQLEQQASENSAGTTDEIRNLLSLQRRILDNLIEDANRYYSVLLQIQEDLSGLTEVTAAYHEFIDKNVFWVRSSQPLAVRDVTQVGDATAWLTDASSWAGAAKAFIARVKNEPLTAALLITCLGMLLYYRRATSRALEDLAVVASAVSCRSLLPTVHAMLLTTLLAAFWPMCMWLLGWGLGASSNELIQAISFACKSLALALFSVEFVRQVCRPQGLGVAHFGASSEAMGMVATHVRILLYAGFPLAILSKMFELQSTPVGHLYVGRLFLVAFLLLLAWVTYRLFHPAKGIPRSYLEQHPNGWLNRTRSVWFWALIIVPVALSGLAINGYLYAASKLTIDVLDTYEFAFLMWLLWAFANRWIRVRRRKIRRQQLLDAQQRAAEEAEEPTSEHDELTVPEEEVDLDAIDHQTRRLLGAMICCLALSGLSVIWIELLPALTPLLEISLWKVAGTGGEAHAITTGHLLLALFVVGVATMASRNIPGLIDVMLLGRLGIEKSMRYAITTISQYAIITVGILLPCHLLGITWDKAQWLVAALGVGLGFGLQEVVANFVCGILLLFERPVRVGDTVTLGETTGVVVRIRTRATTVRNWDRQEVVIPNKELITGRIVNWTLSDRLNRVVVQVRVGFNTETEQAREVLLTVARENSNVMDDPQPVVIFDRFDENGMNLTLRAYLENMDERVETIHQLHAGIHAALQEAGIELALPHRNLHLQSIAPDVDLQGSSEENQSE